MESPSRPSSKTNPPVPSPRLIVVIGPTASGKTRASLEIAKALDSIVLNSDAFQVYKGFSVAVDKIKQTEMNGVPHFGLDITAAEEEFTVRDFLKYSVPVINKELSSGRCPVVVGGTHMYVEKLLFTSRLDEDDPVSSFTIPRSDFDYSFEHLVSVDTPMSKRIHPNDARRIARALDYYYTTGKRLSDILAHQERTLRWRNVLVIRTDDVRKTEGLPNKKHKRGNNAYDPCLEIKIRQRIEEKMLHGDLLKTELLMIKDMVAAERLHWNKGILQAIGYREFEPYLSDWIKSGHPDEKLFDEGVSNLVVNTIRFSKKQKKWLQKLDSMIEIYPYDQIDDLLGNNQCSNVKCLPKWDDS
jgi:tRNA dimethylallyltransferase